MTKLQKILTTFLPKKWADSMEKESRQWKFRCECREETSVWELGGVRWKAKGNPKQLVKCPKCNETSMMKLVKDDAEA